MKFLAVILVVVFACARVNGMEFYVRDGAGCHAIELGDCFTCQPSGSSPQLEMCNNFEEGQVGCGFYDGNNTQSCSYQREYFRWGFTPCAALEQCRVSPSTFLVFSAQNENGLDVLVLPESTGVVAMNGDEATFAGTLNSIVFRSEATGAYLRFIDQYDDGSFLTNLGLCDLGASCSGDGFTYSATSYSSQSDLTEREAAVASLVMNAGAPETPVALEVGDSYAISASSETTFVIYEDGVAVSEASLANVAMSVPPHVSITDMTLKNYDQKYPALVCKLSFRDFETYTEAECYHSELSDPMQTSGVECEFSFSISFDLSELFSNFFFSLSLDVEEPLQEEWEEQPTFTLFE